MSAYLVHKDQIDLLVTAGLARLGHDGCIIYAPNNQRAELRFETATMFGKILWIENLKSVEYRYSDTVGDMENLPSSGNTDIESYEFEAVDMKSLLTRFPQRKTPEVGVLVNAIDGYEYQSCEHPQWDGSLARGYCHWLKDKLLDELSHRDQCNGWDWSRA